MEHASLLLESGPDTSKRIVCHLCHDQVLRRRQAVQPAHHLAHAVAGATDRGCEFGGRQCEVCGGVPVARFELVQQMCTSPPERMLFCAFHNANAITTPITTPTP